ncbi:hypothetical protein T265_15642, partial [Opisthorchis viverrini]
VTTWNNGRWLIIQTNLKARRTPVHGLHCLLRLDLRDRRVHVFRNHIAAIQKTTGVELSKLGKPITRQVDRTARLPHCGRIDQTAIHVAGTKLVTTWNNGRWLIIQTNLKARRTPVHGLHCLLRLDLRDRRVHVFRNHIAAIQKTTGVELSKLGKPITRQVDRTARLPHCGRIDQTAIHVAGTKLVIYDGIRKTTRKTNFAWETAFCIFSDYVSVRMTSVHPCCKLATRVAIVEALAPPVVAGSIIKTKNMATNPGRSTGICTAESILWGYLKEKQCMILISYTEKREMTMGISRRSSEAVHVVGVTDAHEHCAEDIQPELRY